MDAAGGGEGEGKFRETAAAVFFELLRFLRRGPLGSSDSSDADLFRLRLRRGPLGSSDSLEAAREGAKG